MMFVIVVSVSFVRLYASLRTETLVERHVRVLVLLS